MPRTDSTAALRSQRPHLGTWVPQPQAEQRFAQLAQMPRYCLHSNGKLRDVSDVGQEQWALERELQHFYTRFAPRELARVPMLAGAYAGPCDMQ